MGALAVALAGSAVWAANSTGAFTDVSAASLTDKGAAKSDEAKQDKGQGAGQQERAKGGKEAGKSAKSGQNGSPSPSYVGLCRAYRSKTGDHPGKALESSAFTALMKEAGGKSKVGSYCANLLADKAAERGGDNDRGKAGENGQGKSQDNRGKGQQD